MYSHACALCGLSTLCTPHELLRIQLTPIQTSTDFFLASMLESIYLHICGKICYLGSLVATK